MLTTPIIMQWGVCTPPTTYRYLEREFVDKFFETGELRLSSYKEFSKHEDEKLRDTQEAKGVICVRGNNTTAYVLMLHTDNANILCANISSPSGKMFDYFKKDAAIAIYNTTEFGARVSRHIPGVKEGIEGYCIYNDAAIETITSDIDVEKIKSLKESGNDNDLVQAVQAFKPYSHNSIFFLKNPKHSEQQEYRLIWFSNKLAEQAVIIKAPELIELCKPVYKEEMVELEEARYEETKTSGELPFEPDVHITLDDVKRLKEKKLIP